MKIEVDNDVTALIDFGACDAAIADLMMDVVFKNTSDD